MITLLLLIIKDILKTRLNRGRNLLKTIAIVSCLMFSNLLTAQEYRGFGPDGEPEKPLMVGWKVSDDFWTKEHVFYVNGDTIRKSLIEYKGKPLVLDFWATWCVSCVKAFPKLSLLQEKFKGRLNILLVNSASNKDDIKKIQKIVGDHLLKNNLNTIYDDRYMEKLFPFEGVPQYIWINSRGVLEGITSGRLLNDEQLEIIANFK
jgi:thiol-disulfide isomerase/thioredoxin